MVDLFSHPLKTHYLRVQSYFQKYIDKIKPQKIEPMSNLLLDLVKSHF